MPAHSRLLFPDEEGDGEIEDNDAEVKGGAGEIPPGARGAGEVFHLSRAELPVDELERVDEEEPDNEPADEIRNGDAEIDPLIGITVYLAEKPPVASQGHGVYDDVQAHAEERAEEAHTQGMPDLSVFQEIDAARTAGLSAKRATE